MRRIKNFLVLVAVLLTAVMFSVGCGVKNPVVPQTEVITTLALPPVDTSVVMGHKPGVTPMAIPPNMAGWSVVNAYSVGEIYDRNQGDTDWLVHFSIPGRTTRPRYYQVVAKNIWGTWSNWSTNNYAQFYTSYSTGSACEMQFTVGKWKARALSVSMNPGNWAVYYHE